MRRLLSILCAAALVATSAGTALAAPGGQSADNAMTWYLSLGDSLAAGVQPTGDPANMFRTDQGYAEQLLAIARANGQKVSLIKLGCPGETTVTFVQGGICDYEEGSQLAQALVFLKAHRDNVAFITIDLGWNDFQGCDRVPLAELQACISDGVGSIQAHLPGILQTLKTAAPGIPIVGATLYDPFLAIWFQDPGLAALSVQLIQLVNGVETSIFGALGMPVADVQGAFQTTDFTPQPPLGIPLNVGLICAWTWKCSAFQDNHANAEGYHVMAEAFAAKLGF